MLLVWDGLGFFGFALHKLNRIKGEPVTWKTRIVGSTAGWVAIGYVFAIFMVVFFELSKYGDQKQTAVTLTHESLLTYNITNGMPITHVNFLYVDELITKVRLDQYRNTSMTKEHHPTNKIVPVKYSDFDWADKAFLNWWVCESIICYYGELQSFDPTYYADVWFEARRIKFKCMVHEWANDKIRVM